MMIFLRLIIPFMLAIWASNSEAEIYRRIVNFEWDAVEGASKYELEIKNTDGNNKKRPQLFKVQANSWEGKLDSGHYTMRMRSFDERSVPGEWSEPSEFIVNLETPELQFPLENQSIETNSTDSKEIEIKWSAVEQANSYRIEIKNGDHSISIQKETSATEFKVELPVANSFEIKLNAISKKGTTSEIPAFVKFNLIAKAIDRPRIIEPESEFVREIKWKPSDFSTSYQVEILRFDESQKNWQSIKSIQDYKGTTLPFSRSFLGGEYKVQINAKADLRKSSETSIINFKVKSGDRSPAAEFVATVRRSIERFNGWYGIASYLITNIQFSGTNADKNSVVNYTALGGTGRLGLGWNYADQPWGFLGISDLSGFTFQGKTRTFASLEANAIYKNKFKDRGEYRIQFGPYYKELPQTIGDYLTNNAEEKTIAAAGSHLGAEYWYSLTPKLGFQMHAHLYYSLLKLKTPNGQPLVPTLSSQYGFLGSYRLTREMTGLLGYSYRQDKMSYKSKTGPTSFAQGGEVNESVITGHYLNFFAEWAF